MTDNTQKDDRITRSISATAHSSSTAATGSITESAIASKIAAAAVAAKEIKNIQPLLSSPSAAVGVEDADDPDYCKNTSLSNSSITDSSSRTLSEEQLRHLYHHHGDSEGITVDVHLSHESDIEESLKQALSELSKISTTGLAATRKHDENHNKTEDDIVSHAIQQSRLGKFPFTKFQNQCKTPPTPLDRLVMDVELLRMVQQIFRYSNSKKQCSNAESTIATTTIYPRLVEARLIDLNNHSYQTNNDLDDIYGTFIRMMTRGNQNHWIPCAGEDDDDDDDDDNNNTDNNDNDKNDGDHRFDVVKVTVPLSFRDRMKYTQIQIDFLNMTLLSRHDDYGKKTNNAKAKIIGETNNKNISSSSNPPPDHSIQDGTNNNNNNNNRTPIQPALQLLFRRASSQNVFEGYDDISIRYLEHAQQSWLCQMNTLQKCSLGFPSPNHEYWTNPTALAQLHKRYYRTTTISTNNSSYCSDSNQEQQETTIPSSSSMSCSNGSFPSPPDGCQKSQPDETYLEPCRLMEPELVDTINSEGFPLLSQNQINQFRNEGYLILDGIFSNNILQDGIDAAYQLWPTATPTSSTYDVRDFAYPFKDERLNQITLDPRLWSVMRQLLDTKDIVIMQSACFAKRGSSTSTNTKTTTNHNEDANNNKYSSTTAATGAEEEEEGKNDNEKIIKKNEDTKHLNKNHVQPTISGNQPIHWDFGSNTLLTPSRCPSHWSSQVEEVQGILYYDDHNEVGGGTAFVPGLQHTDQNLAYNGWYPDHNDDDDLEDDKKSQTTNKDDPRCRLYELERQVKFHKGTMLLFQLGTWHRGTPVLPKKVRHVHHLCFRRSDCTWIGTSDAFGQPTVRTIVDSRNNTML